MTARLTVVGIGADGYDGLGAHARDALASAPLVVGSTRQLELLPAAATTSGARRLAWPSPLEPLLDELADGRHGDAAVLASGDPMLHGIGASLARRVEAGAADAAGGVELYYRRAAVDVRSSGAGPGEVRLDVIPHPSAFALACARLGWPAAETELLSTVARAPALVARALQPGRRLVVYATGRDGAARIAAILAARGFGPSRFVVLEQLGGPAERVHEATADTWGDRAVDPLHALAIEPRPAPGAHPLPTTPGLPDDAFDHDGQLTKRHVRAVTLAALAPLPGELLWDIGAGNGSIAIEWLRATAGVPAAPARAVAFEADATRAARIAANAARLGVPQLHVVHGRVPASLADAAVDPVTAQPDAVFVGGGVTAPGLLEAAWHAVRPGGRIVVNAVTLESQARLLAARAEHGGTLTQIAIAHAAPVGTFTGWRQQLPVVQWEARKEEEPQR
ncbi:precorrin-6Y C5,15-methyltransferase (decarboxylating) subunit CbiT [Conexibacter stalactiti]|uniref:Precorrin-6Y C5,15-methyltransferase (Decarboxylating) subunit CbiT n=1 Tax=Conexibacter stalactiti TaxID=1940611 RepID=A0ABU4HWK7_9ACTN|nr:precorrin-6Y C5,15-methyltransferase (decarboxylating) subunit CbiT [Conexibacter stalactiti]MDW5597209.1 precorrin-6Y C5,15-methyltransferase (decarboxylating) subunit CbiT [Conexibacter stalactiti]MEC5037851.1 precorrin-6Y C5,15-methyltransferase (decarboxylating) subunit CbiT [Conexibacter stalactiti]